MSMMTYAEAGCLALAQEMERDTHVWALGEDVGPEGGVAGQYRGLLNRFGPQRIVDTPISESMIMAAAIGSSLLGMRPVAELRYADFALCAADEIINQAAKARYMQGGQVRVPIVIRQHSIRRVTKTCGSALQVWSWWHRLPQQTTTVS